MRKLSEKLYLNTILSLILLGGVLYWDNKCYLEESYFKLKQTLFLSAWQAIDRPLLIYAMPPRDIIGDVEAMARLILCAKKMGWNVLPHFIAQHFPQEKLTHAFGIFIYGITLRNTLSFPDNIPIYEIRWLVKSTDTHFTFHPNTRGLLGTSYHAIDKQLALDPKQDPLKFMLTWYPTVQTTYYEPKPKRLMFAGGFYPGNARIEAEKYQHLWQQLDKAGYFVVYGQKKAWKNNTSYRGTLPADGEAFVAEINKHGICLVLHGEAHLAEGVPSGRIFEAAAASAVIISDKHAFVEREFKDSVLYIDHTQDNLFEQIEAHMQWIKTHPREAKNKARLAHAIFMQKFTLEQQLARLYQAYLNDKKT